MFLESPESNNLCQSPQAVCIQHSSLHPAHSLLASVPQDHPPGYLRCLQSATAPGRGSRALLFCSLKTGKCGGGSVVATALGIKGKLMESQHRLREFVRRSGYTKERVREPAAHLKNRIKRQITTTSAILTPDFRAGCELWVFHYNQS